ncbi:hypothetical protein MMC07_008789 [Pseudocyphellaria aurata]|nr:hypothetical protein [Pseudocyphellaria aurata]
MFGTLHYNAGSDETQFVERSTGRIEEGGNAIAHFACDSCRAKKVERNALWSKNLSLTTPLCHFSFDAMARNEAVSGARLPPPIAHTLIIAAREGSSENTMPMDIQPMDIQPMDIQPMDIQGLGKKLLARLKHHLISKPCLTLERVQSSQDHDASEFDFSYSNIVKNIVENTDKTVDNSIPNQQPSPDLTASSPRLDPIIPSASSISGLTPQWSLENDSVSTHPPFASDNVLAFPTFESDISTHTSNQTLCRCPHAMSALLEESQSRSSRISIQTTHFTLAHIKTALERCTRTLDCSHCSPRSDHMMLAAVVINRLVSILEEVVRVYTQRRASSSASSSSSFSSSSVPLNQQQQSDASPHHQKPHYRYHQDRNSYYDLFIGDYAINSEVELAAVMTALTVVLVKDALSLLERMKGVARAKGRETQLQMLWGAEQRARKIAGSMRDVAGAGIGG